MTPATDTSGSSSPKQPSWLPEPYILATLVGLAAIGGVTAYVVRNNYQTTLNLWKSELRTSVRYHGWALQNSLEQSQDDAHLLAEFPSTKKLLAPGASDRLGTHNDLRLQVAGLFKEYSEILGYRAVYLADPSGRALLQPATSTPMSTLSGDPRFAGILETVLRSAQPAVELRESQSELNLVVLAPVLDDATRRLIGVVAIADPFSRELFPLLTAAKVVLPSEETLLLQIASGEAHYAHLRPTKSTTRLGNAENDTLLRAAPAALEDSVTFDEFVDSAGAPVLASLQKIRTINAVLVCKVNKDEAFVDFRQATRIDIAAAVLAFLAYFGLVLIRHRSVAARKMRKGLARQQALNQQLESVVAQRTGQLAETNEQLNLELAERKRAEEEVRLLNIDLDRRVRERTADLEAANKELEAFSYSVSHDLRAPLRRMNGFSTILREEYGALIPDAGRHLLGQVSKNAVQMGELIDSLLGFSRLGRQPLRKQNVFPDEIVRQAWQELSAERNGRAVEFVSGELPDCRADAVLLKQVFVNLLSNALKYSRARQPSRIEVGYADSGAYFVRDNGVGFDMRYSEKLFSAFKRLHRAEDYEGIGIGLANVERIVTRHGGRIWADAAIDKGATFYFTLGQ